MSEGMLKVPLFPLYAAWACETAQSSCNTVHIKTTQQLHFITDDLEQAWGGGNNSRPKRAVYRGSWKREWDALASVWSWKARWGGNDFFSHDLEMDHICFTGPGSTSDVHEQSVFKMEMQSSLTVKVTGPGSQGKSKGVEYEERSERNAIFLF